MRTSISICPYLTTAASQLVVCRQWAECMVTQSDRETRVLIVPDAGSNKPIELRVASVISLRLHYVTLYECDRCQRSRSLSVTNVVDNGTFMYSKHGKLVDADSWTHLESCLEVVQGHTFWDHWKADEGLRITVYGNNVGLGVGNFEGKVW